MTAQQKQGNLVGIITMIFLFGMISFVTNLAAPIGTIWKNNPDFASLGMLGNMMNFLAYLIMGIPAGKMLAKIGYKKSALVAIALGFLGIFVQFLSGKTGGAGFYVYLLGAFIAGFCVCILNTVVNPMLTILGGGGKKGNALLQFGGGFNSLMATITPIIVMALIGDAAKASIADVNPLLYIAMGVFVLAFIILLFVPIKEIHKTDNVVYEKSPWAFRHFVLGAIAIFCYVGVEVGIPAGLLYWLPEGAGVASATAGFVAGMYWLLMMVGRFLGSAVGSKVSSKAMMVFTTALATILIVAAIFIPKDILTSMPAFQSDESYVGFVITQVPVSALLLVLCGLCTSIMWGSIFNLATDGLGKYTPPASGIFMMMVVGGGVIPLVQEWIAGAAGWINSYWLIIAAILYMLFYSAVGSKNVNKDIKVD